MEVGFRFSSFLGPRLPYPAGGRGQRALCGGRILQRQRLGLGVGGVDCVGCTHAAAGCNPPPTRSRRTLTNEMRRGGTSKGRPGPSFTLIAGAWGGGPREERSEFQVVEAAGSWHRQEKDFHHFFGVSLSRRFHFINSVDLTTSIQPHNA